MNKKHKIHKLITNTSQQANLMYSAINFYRYNKVSVVYRLHINTQQKH